MVTGVQGRARRVTGDRQMGPTYRPAPLHNRRRDTYLRRLLRALLSALVPGAGQLLAGVRKRGFILLSVVVALVIAAVIIASRGIDSVISWMLQPKVLIGVLAVNVLLLLFRLFAVVDAFRTRKEGTLRPFRPSRLRLGLIATGLILLLALTIAPHAIAGYYTLISRDLLTSVFTAKSTSSSDSSPTTSLTGGSLDWGTDGRMTVLLIGTDGGYGREGVRADSINIATINPTTGDVAIFGIPRNTADVPLGKKTAAALGTSSYSNIINSLYETGWKHPELAPQGGDPGAEAVKETASLILGVPIDYYAVVNMTGLSDLVNAFGGITIDVKTTINVRFAPLRAGEPAKVVDIEPGVRHLDGDEALAYARSRTGSDDYARMKRQRCVLLALLYQNGPAKLALKFPSIVSAVKKNVTTDIPLDALSSLVKIRGKLKTDNMIAVGFIPPDYITGHNSQGYNDLNLPFIHTTVDTIMNRPADWIAAHPTDVQNGGASDCWKAASGD